MPFSGQALARHWQTTKRVLGDGWNSAIRLSMGLDHGMRLGKKILAAATPLIDSLGGGHHVDTAMRGIHAYDSGRAHVNHQINNVETHYRNIRRQVPEIGL
jgi:hypothetical protein